MQTVTLLDLRLGHVQLNDDQRRMLRRAMVPVLVDVTDRILRQSANNQTALDHAAVGQQGD